MVSQFVSSFGQDANGSYNAQELQNKAGQTPGGGKPWNFKDKQNWKAARAILKRMPTDVIALAPGETATVEIEVLNDTTQPWKPDCMITFADE